jgi:beta propeller repeat protein
MRGQRRGQLLVASLLCVVSTGPLVRGAVTVLRVATTAEDEAFPSVCGNTVIWQYFNSRYGDWEISGADIADPAVPLTFAITDLPGDDVYPVIDGNDVVWQHQWDADSDADVYATRIENHQRTALYAVSAFMDDERLPSVSHGVVVWQHRFVGAPDWDVFGARLTGVDNPDAFAVSAGIDIDELAPCISGNLVVWYENAADLPQPMVYGADISDPNNPHVFYTTMGLGAHEMPSLSEGWLVARQTDDVGKVFVDNLFDPFNPQGISGSGLTACPRIHKHIVVWQDQSNGTWDIRGYNLITHQEFAVTNMRMSDQVNPAVYVDTKQQRAIIVWQDGRDGNWDIYAAIVDGPEIAAAAEP